jgi:TRAP-type C4-dicarboxylate transport system substrate-binding protein
MSLRRHSLCLVIALLPSLARAKPVTLRIASAAPEGSAWANLFHSLGRELAQATHDEVLLKWYMGGITGDEPASFAGIQAGHLDGVASGGPICERLAPSMRIQGLAGVFQSRDETAYVMERLRSTLEDETRHNGFELVIISGLGPEVLFTRTPVRSMNELRKLKLWMWSADEVGVTMARAMGLTIVATDLDDAAQAYDDRRSDGFIAIPTAALAFQWSTQARYVTDLRPGYLAGCILITSRAMDRVPPAYRTIFRALFAKYDALFQEVGRRQDDALLGGLFQKQGLTPLHPSEGLRSEFFESARTVRERVVPGLVPRALLDRVLKLLADYRAEHPGQ